jgi:hypothetical protein
MFAILSKDIRHSRRVGRELRKLGILTISLNASTATFKVCRPESSLLPFYRQPTYWARLFYQLYSSDKTRHRVQIIEQVQAAVTYIPDKVHVLYQG